MKKLLTYLGLALLLVAMIVTVVACGPNGNGGETTPAETTAEVTPGETTVDAGEETTVDNGGETTAEPGLETADEDFQDNITDDTIEDIF